MMNNQEQAAALISYCAEAVDNTHTFGRLTSSIYDTAWVAILRKPNSKKPELLFPECYNYILNQQHSGSGWEKSPESEIDGIMCTLGGLFALSKNSDIVQDGVTSKDIAARIQNGSTFLITKLQTWDVASCDHVGFEIIIPCMLEHLKDKGLTFTFPGQPLLTELNQLKLAKIHPAIWSGKVQTTITHSLEAFLGKADFSGLRDQQVCGGMGSSPSSTAAYLISTSAWDIDAEQYLRTVLSSRHSGEIGGVPGMYPTTGFEVLWYLWIASTLLEDGFDASSLPGIKSVLTVIDEFHESLNGFASGFSKSSVPDADDTSKSIMICNLLGIPTAVDKLVETFEGKDHFVTYMMERHPSVTTNCNALSAILLSPEPTKFIPQIEKIARFLCISWKQSDLPFQDKWNISEFYPIMLLSQALCRLLNSWDHGNVDAISEELMRDDVALVLFQVLMQTLQKQNSNGSWGHTPSKEITAYAIIALANLASLPIATQLSGIIRDAIGKGRSFISSDGVTPEIEYVWIAKTNYSPVNISKAYILAALETKFPKYSLGPSFNSLLDISPKTIKKYTEMFSNLPTLTEYPLWRIEGSVTEASLFLRRLKSAKITLFDRASLKGDEYFEFIAMTFVCANNLHGSFLKTDILFDMMVYVLNVYQIDEYFEHLIASKYEQHLSKIKQLVARLFEDATPEDTTPSNGVGHKKRKLEHQGTNGNGEIAMVDDAHSNSIGNGILDHEVANSNGVRVEGPNGSTAHDASFTQSTQLEISEKIKSFITTVLENPAVKRADATDRQLLRNELHRCLLAHATQLEDSKSHYQSLKSGSEWKTPCGSYHAWVRTIAAAHSCSPLSLAFFRCLLPNDVAGRTVIAEEQYLIQDMWMHLGNKARMENDRASVRRDRREGNLNSVDFPEFTRANGRDATKESITQLTRIIDYEKKCCKLGFKALDSLWDVRRKNTQVEGLKFYYFVEEIYNDVYVLKDISSERK